LEWNVAMQKPHLFMRPILWLPLLAVAACQPAPVSPDAPAPVASAAPTVAPSPTTTPSVDGLPSTAPTSPATQSFTILRGRVIDDEGGAVNRGVIELRETPDGAVIHTAPVGGGAYIVPSLATGRTWHLRFVGDGYTERARTLSVPAADFKGAYDVHFGGDSPAFAPSVYPEIMAVSPASRSTDAVSPMRVTMRLSHPISSSQERNLFSRLLKLRYIGAVGESSVGVGDLFGEEATEVVWNEAGTEATFRLDVPIVTHKGPRAAFTITFDQSRPADEWPRDANQRRLGRGLSYTTYDAADVRVSTRISPFLRDLETVTISPSPRPSAEALWGETHRTGSTFSFKADTSPLKVVSAVGLRGIAGQPDRIQVTFNKPINGFPSEWLDGSALRSGNYRFVLGRVEKADDLKRFNESNPAVDGGSSPESPAFHPIRYDVVVIPLPAGTLEPYTDFKLYVDADVKDIHGMPVTTSAQDPATHLADHVIKGRIQ
jgi:hypothetical protein